MAAALAGDAAPVAEDLVAVMAEVPLVAVHRAAAVVTRFPAPPIQLDVGTAAGVRGKRLRYDGEEVQEPSLGNRRPDGGPAFALAEALVLDVGMGDAVVAGRRVGVEGHDAIGG